MYFLLEDGKFVIQGKTEDVIQHYLERSNENKSEFFFNTKVLKHKVAYATSLRVKMKMVV
jgi:hypothetical protein